MAGASRWTPRHDDGERGRAPADGQFSGPAAGGLSRRSARSAGRAPWCSTGISYNVGMAAWLPAAVTMNAGDEAWNATQRTHWSPHAGPPASPRSEGPAPPWSQASAASAPRGRAPGMSAVTALGRAPRSTRSARAARCSHPVHSWTSGMQPGGSTGVASAHPSSVSWSATNSVRLSANAELRAN